jgi:RecA/RadA recombinase
MSKTDDIKKALTKTGKKRLEPVKDNELLKTGCTALDLAISGRRAGGFAKGHYFWMCGDSRSGKTFLMLTCLAEASINPEFDDYRFIYDNGENGALMDMERYYGGRMASRLEPPAVDDDGDPVFSEEIEDFYFNLDDALTECEKGGRPFIYLLDSMDALDSKYNEAKFQEAKKAARKGTKAKGDYGDGKAKINSTRLRRVVARLRATGSILIILSQTRDNINAGMFEEQQTHAGGRALKFYATVQLWSSVGSRIKKTVKGREMVIGVHCRVKTKKNRLTGKERVVEFPIYYDSGIDDIGGMVDFLTYWKHWPTAKGGMVDATVDFDDVKMRREELIRWIEDNDLREDLEDIVEAAWADIEKRLAVGRKSKYD